MAIILKCEKGNFDGTGVVKYQNKSYNIFGILPDEEGLFSIEGGKWLKLDKIIKKSDLRIKPLCPVSDVCGGCQYQHISYEDEIKIKNDYIADLFSYLKMPLKKINEMYNPYYYRNKCQMAYKLSKTKKVVSGLYEEHTHRVVPVEECVLHAKPASKVIQALNEVLSKHKIEPYDERTGEGTIRHVLIRYGFFSKETMVVLVTNGEMFPGRNNVLKDLKSRDLGITTIVQNYNFRDTSIVLGENERIIYGPGYIYDTLGDLKFKISSRSFYQVNTVGMKRLYEKAVAMADIKNTDIVLDAYSGIGTISLFASKSAKAVYGVELNKDAHSDAIVNARINKITNCTFINEDATAFMNKNAGNMKTDIIIMDPPREGSTIEFIKAIGKIKPKKIIYVSCDPKSLKRDLKDIFLEGYKISDMEFFDMFPRTFNIETVVCLVKKED